MTRVPVFKDSIVLVTGGSSGIGRATAVEFARQGADVWLLARYRPLLDEALTAVRAACTAPDQRCGVVQADVSDESQVSAAVAEVLERAGLPDIVVNSAGIVRPGYFQDLDVTVFRDMMEVDYFGTLYMCKAVVPGMIKRGSGHLVNVSSFAAVMPVFGYSAYGAAKHAVRGLSEVMRLELKVHGIQVSVVYPPDTDTPQLAYDLSLRPAECEPFDIGPTLPPAAVARAIVKGVERNQFIITPDPATTVVRRLVDILGGLQYPILDTIISRGRPKIQR